MSIIYKGETYPVLLDKEDRHFLESWKWQYRGAVYECIREAAEQEGLVYNTLKSRLNGQLQNNTTLRFL
jgi:hypothetical protein